MKRKSEVVDGLLLAIGHREAGSFVREDGTLVEYEAADKITLLPMGEERGAVKKFTILEAAADAIYAATEEVSWAAQVSLSLREGKVIGLRVLRDAFAEDLDAEIEL